MAIEIVDLPIKNGGSFHSYVNVETRPGTMGFILFESYDGWPWVALILGWLWGPDPIRRSSGESWRAWRPWKRSAGRFCSSEISMVWWCCNWDMTLMTLPRESGRCGSPDATRDKMQNKMQKIFRIFCSDVRNFCRVWPAWKNWCQAAKQDIKCLDLSESDPNGTCWSAAAIQSQLSTVTFVL